MEGKKGLVTVSPVTETDAAEVCMICCEDFSGGEFTPPILLALQYFVYVVI
jgi:hypothetical protein